MEKKEKSVFHYSINSPRDAVYDSVFHTCQDWCTGIHRRKTACGLIIKDRYYDVSGDKTTCITSVYHPKTKKVRMFLDDNYTVIVTNRILKINCPMCINSLEYTLQVLRRV